MQNLLTKKQKYIPGIYGGMGPLSHIYFEQLLLANSFYKGANQDQDHPVWILVSGTSTPDRTKSIEGNKSSVFHLKNFAKVLENTGANFVIMICNTAHKYIDEVRSSVKIPVLSMIEFTEKEIQLYAENSEKVGLLATDGTLVSGIYQHTKIKNLFIPKINSQIQGEIMDIIYNSKYGVKSTGNVLTSECKSKFKLVLEWFSKNNIKSVITGCTEISLLMNAINHNFTVYDPLKITANKVIDISFAKTDKKMFKMLNLTNPGV